MLKTKTLLCCLLVAFSAVSIARAEGRRIAVLVGINTYDDASAIPQLRYCVSDAEIMYKQLTTNCGYQKEDVLLMHDEYDRAKRHLWPELDNLQRQVPLWLERAGEEDTVLFFFSGHGFLNEGEGILAPLDCQAKDLAQTGLRTEQLKEWLLACKAKRKFLILDCCHSGVARKGRNASTPLGEELGGEKLQASEVKIPENKRIAFERSEGLVTLASCTREEQSLEWEEEEHGLFTYFLARGLSGSADLDKDGIINHLELFQFTVAKVTSTAQVEFNAQQTPVLFHDRDARGLFQLATVARSVTPEEIYLAVPEQSDKSQLPAAPGELAHAAYGRLAGGKGTAADRLVDAQVLVEEAVRLREASETTAKSGSTTVRERATNPFLNPYFNDDRAATVAKWLATARKEFERQPAAAQPVEMTASLAIATWHQPDRDKELARQLIDELAPYYPYDKQPTLRNAQAKLLMIHAETRDDSDPGRREALASYAMALDLIDEHEQLAKRSLRPNFVNGQVIAPAMTIADGLGKTTDAKLAQQIAKVYGSYGNLIDKNNFFNKTEEAQQSLAKAIQLDPNNAAYHLGLGSVILQLDEPDYAAVRKAVEKTLALSQDGSKANHAIAHRLGGDAWFRESRGAKSGSLSSRMEKVSQAVKSYDEAIQLFSQIPVDDLDARGRRHYGDSFLSRSAAHLELANLTPSITSEQRNTYLDQSREDARRAGDVDKSRGYQAYIALGNALEDLAWLQGKTEFYTEALEAFTKAGKLRFDSPMCWLCRGRCQYKRVVDGKQGNFLPEALSDLEYALRLDPLPESHYWIGMVHWQNENFDEADSHLTQAVEMSEQAGQDTTRHDRKVFLEKWAELALVRGEKLAGQPAVQGSGGEATRQLALARFRAGQLREFDPLQSTLLIARSFEAEAKYLLENRNVATNVKGADTSDAIEKLNAALGEYTRQLESKEIVLPRSTQVAFLCRRAELLLTSPLWEEDVKLATPIALASADEAVKLAVEKPDKAQALAWAGMARLKIAIAGQTPERTEALLGEAETLLGQALATYNENSQSWQWSDALGQLLLRRARMNRSQQDLQQLVLKGCEHFQFAFENCPEHAKPAIQAKWKALYEMRK